MKLLITRASSSKNINLGKILGEPPSKVNGIHCKHQNGFRVTGQAIRSGLLRPLGPPPTSSISSGEYLIALLCSQNLGGNCKTETIEVNPTLSPTYHSWQFFQHMLFLCTGLPFPCCVRFRAAGDCFPRATPSCTLWLTSRANLLVPVYLPLADPCSSPNILF